MEIEITGQPRKEWMNDAEYKSISLATQQVEDRTVTGIAGVCGNVDDVGDVVHRGAFAKTITEGKNRVRHLWNHDFTQPPIARIDELKEIGRDELPAEIKSKYPEATGGLLVKRTYHAFPRADEIFQNVASGGLNEMSFGYNALQKDYGEMKGMRVRNVRQARLLDTSDVNWGANPATISKKGAIPYHSAPKAAADAAWDGPAEVAKASIDDLKMMCAWVDSAKEEDKGSYKLPHHRSDDGHTVVWDGVKAAMGALMGSRGGVEIPAADRRAVYDHLAKHYEQFGQEPPDYKMIEIAYSVKDARNLMLAGVDFKVGRMISAANEAKIRSVMDSLEQQLESLEELLGLAESPAEEAAEDAGNDAKALTQPEILLALLDLRLAELQISED